MPDKTCMDVQIALAVAGYPVKMDGSPGPKTYAAICKALEEGVKNPGDDGVHTLIVRKGVVVTSGQGRRYVPGMGWGDHAGLDLSELAGDPAEATMEGSVVHAGDAGDGYGISVVLQHDDMTFSRFGHLASTCVSVGQRVSRGEQIGIVGSTGKSTGTHLHWELRAEQPWGPVLDLQGRVVLVIR